MEYYLTTATWIPLRFMQILRILSDIIHIMILQERLGELPENEDLRSGRNDQHVDSETQQSEQTEAVEGGQ